MLLLSTFFVAACGYLVVRHLLWPGLDEWRPRIVALASQALGRPVAIGSIETGWSGLHPELTLRDVVLSPSPVRWSGPGHSVSADAASSATLGPRPMSDAAGAAPVLGPPPRASSANAAGADEPPLALPEVSAVLSWRSLLIGQPRFASLRLVGARLEAERGADGTWSVAGFSMRKKDPADRSGLRWLLAQRRIELVDSRLELRDASAGPPMVFEGAAGLLQNIGRTHRFAVRADRVVDGARVVGRSLDLRGDFVHPAYVPASSIERWRGQAYLAAQSLEAGVLAARLPALRALLPASATPWLPSRGTLDSVAAWIDADGGQVRSAALKAAGRNLVLTPKREPIALAALRVDLRLARDDDGYRVEVRQAALREADGVSAKGLRLATSSRPLHGRLDLQGAPREFSVRLDELELSPLLALAHRLPLPPELEARLPARDAAAGRLQRVKMDWSAPVRAAEAPRLAIEADFDQLRLAAHEPAPGRRLGLPGVTGMAGRVEATRDDGRVQLDARRSSATFPGLFEEPTVPLDRVAGTLRWRIDRSGDHPVLQVDTERLAFSNADATGELTGMWASSPHGPGRVDLQGRLADADAVRTARYLPVWLAKPVRDWVGNAVLAGRADRVDLRLRGDLADFPFRDPATGEFRVAARLGDGVLWYGQDWPAIEGIQGELVFERAGMSLSAPNARIYGVRLANVRATIDDFVAPLLRIDGAGTGPAQDMVRFVNETPLRTRIDDFTVDVRAAGEAKLSLALVMPLAAVGATRVEGAVQFTGNDLVLDRTLPPFDAVSGRFEFTETGFGLRDIQATFLGGPLRVSGSTTGQGRMRIRGEGTVGVDGMRSLIDNALTRRLSGRMNYVATVDVQRRASAVRLESDLIGLAVDMPAPFGKAAADAWPLRVENVPAPPVGSNDRPGGDVVSAQLGESVRVAFERSRGADDKLRIRRGAFAVNGETVLPDAGFAVLVALPQLDLDAWHALLADGDLARAAQPSDEFADGFTLLPSTVSVVSENLRVAGKDLHRVVLGASRVDGFWRANVSSREVDGFFNWREAGTGQGLGLLTARFARLAIPPSRAAEMESLLDSAPDQLPALDIAAQEFVLGDRSLGSLALRATNGGTPANPVWTLEKLELDAPDAKLVASGRWARAPGSRARATDLEFELTVADSGSLLSRFGVNDAIRGGQGVLGGELSWRGSPLSIDYPSLSGLMRLEVGKGQFMKVDPGIAKLIGVINLQSIPRRLALDFRDVFSEGFAFDRIDADVRIERGIAQTDNFRMRGLQAAVRIRGTADLARETQDLHVRVVPEINAGLPALAYAAVVNPAIGLGAFVAQWALRRPLSEAFAYEVDVRGAWDDPQVTARQRASPQPQASP